MVPLGHRLLWAWALALVSVLPARAAETWPVPRGSSREPVPYRYQPSRLKQVPRPFLDDAAACTVYCGTTYLVEPDGTIETIVHDITRLNGRKGIEKLGEYRHIYYDPAHESLTLNEARVIKPSGLAVAIEPKHVQLRDVSTDYQVYDHSKQLVISFPSLEVGDLIEVKWTTRGKNPEHQGHFFTRYRFGDDSYPVVLDELRVRLPKSKPLKFAAIGGKLEPTVQEDQTWRTWLWQVNNRRQLPQDDYLPSREELRLYVACSTFASWSEVGRWKQKLRADCWKCTSEIRKAVQEVTAGLDTPEAKARALTYWVRRNIRYVSVGEKHDYTPHQPSLVFANRYGDCKDTTQLLAVMLKEAGVPVALATIGTRDDGQVAAEVPSPWGTHAILLVTLDGKDHWIDTTASLAPWNFLPRDCRDRLAYIVDDSGLRLVRTPPSSAESNRIEQTTLVTIGADGSSRMERTLLSHGSSAMTRRDDWLEVPSGERRRLLTTELQDAQSRARLRQLSIDEKKLRDFDQPVSARMVFEVPGHFTGENIREGSLTDSPVWNRLLSYNLDHDREFPLQLGAPFESIHRCAIHLPAAYRLESVPHDRLVRSKWGTFRLSVRSDPADLRRLELEFHTRLEATRVVPADFEAFRKFHDEVLKRYRVWLALEPVKDLKESRLLESIVALTPGDSSTAAVLARLYLRHDLYADARRVLQRARACRPNDASLLELAVKVARDLQEVESLYRELIKRNPGEPRYVVALGKTLIDRGQHSAAKTALSPLALKGPAAWRAEANLQLARSLAKQSQAELALKHFEAAAAADAPAARTINALLLLGQIHEDLNQPKEAAQAYRRVLVQDPDDAEALAALVRLELTAGNKAEALDHLRRYATLVSDADELAQAADWYLRLERPDEALDLAQRAHEKKPSPLSHRTLGLIRCRRGDLAKAAPDLEKAEPDAQVVEGLIRCHLGLGELRKAEQQLERAEKIVKTTPELTRACALTVLLVQRRTGLLKEVPQDKSGAWAAGIDRFVCAEQAWSDGRPLPHVESLLAPVFTDGVELGAPYALRGWLALERGRLAKALADAEQALKLNPKETRGWLVRGRVRLERNQNGAVADLTRAAELSGWKDPITLHWLAAAMYRARAVHEAVRTQQEAVKLRPNDPELLEQLRELENAVKSASGQ